jgi:hypothetical protein
MTKREIDKDEDKCQDFQIEKDYAILAPPIKG